jgi:hypothetical protein
VCEENNKPLPPLYTVPTVPTDLPTLPTDLLQTSAARTDFEEALQAQRLRQTAAADDDDDADAADEEEEEEDDKDKDDEDDSNNAAV